MFDTVLLKSFVTVVQESSFTRAAVRLNLTQSAVSAHLRRLEDQAGRTLLDRTTRSITLTHDGELLLGYARAILTLNDDALAHLSRTPSSGTIRIGLSEDVVHIRLMNIVQDFATRFPLVSFSVKVGIPGRLLQAMDDGELELVIGGRCHDERPGRFLWREPLVWAAAEWATFNASAPLPLALFPDPCPYREAALATLAHAGVDYRVAMVCPSGAGLYAAVMAGFAVTPVVQSQLTQGLRIVQTGPAWPMLPDVEFILFSIAAPSNPVLEELCNSLALTFRHTHGPTRTSVPKRDESHSNAADRT